MKKIYYLLLIFIFIPINVLAITLPKLHSTNIILYDPEEDEILYEKGSDEVVNIASLTKIMTTIVAIENIKDLNAYVTITENMLSEVPSDASVAGLKVGDKVTYLDLLYASILPSGADATTALAHGISGKTKEFINLMNKKGEELKLEHTHFSNVTGYDINNHYSTPKEVLEILLYALENPLFNEIYKTKDYTLTNGLKVESTLFYYNKNNIYDLSSILGSKTGFTSKAGMCMSSIIKVVDKELILITLGAERIYGTAYNIDDAITVINYLNDNFKNEKIYTKGDILFSIPVLNSDIDYYDVLVKSDIVTYTDVFNEEDFRYEYDGIESLSFNNKKGDKLGTITYYYKDKVYTENVFLDKNINISLTKYFKEYMTIPDIIFGVVIIFILLLTFRRRKRKAR